MKIKMSCHCERPQGAKQSGFKKQIASSAFGLLAMTIVSLACFCISSPSAFALFEDKEKEQIAALEKQLADVTSDRDNILTQAKTFLHEKEELMRKINQMKDSTSEEGVELESLKKESEILKSEIEKLKASRLQDEKLYQTDKETLERAIADEKAKTSSLASTMQEYTPGRIQQLIEDRNRLEEENKRMAQRVFENEKQMEEMRRQLSPLELDREELFRIQGENRELNKRMQYVEKLEKREGQMLKENAEYREQVEILKAKFKDAVPGLAKSGRISQKMMRENADMHYNLGTIFLHNKQYREAIREYERVLELRPSDPETHYNLGILYDDFVKDRQKALYHYQKYMAINPKAPDAKKVESYILSLELEQKVH